MKINTSILMGLLFLTIGLSDYLNSDYNGAIVLIGISLFFIVTGLFEIKNYHNKKLYFTIIAAIIASWLILTYIQISSQAYQGDKLFNSTYAGTMSVVFMWAAYYFTKKWELFKKDVKLLNYFLIAFIIFFIGLEVFVKLMIYY